MRNWSHETIKQMFPGASGTSGAVGPGASGRARFSVGGHCFGVVEGRLCRGWYAETPYTTALDAWRAEFGSVAEENPLIHDEIFSELKESFSTLEPFSSWDPRVTISLNEVESTAFDVASVRFFHLSDPLESFHSVFARRRGEDSWLRIYDADVDWRLEEARISGFTQAHLLEWSAIASGRYEDQVIDLNQLFSEAGSASAGDN